MKRKFVILSLLVMNTFMLFAQQISATQDVFDCGQILFRKPVNVDFTLQNKGSRDLMITNVRTSCGCTKVDYPREPIAHNRSFTVRVTYDAKQMGHFEKQVGIYSDGSKEPLLLTVRGVVVSEIVDFSGEYPFSLGEIRSDLNELEFDDVNRGDRPFQRIHIMNTGSASVQPVVMHLPAYLTAQVSPSSIAPGHAGIVTILLDSRKLRDFGLTQTSVFLGQFPGDKVSPNKEITVSSVLLPDFRNLSEADLSNAPKMELSTFNLDLGSFEGKVKKKGEILITNHGKSPLKINNLQMFSTGLQLSLNKTKIAPGETAKLKVTAEAKSLQTARSKPRILMITNDPDHSKVIINILIK